MNKRQLAHLTSYVEHNDYTVTGIYKTGPDYNMLLDHLGSPMEVVLEEGGGRIEKPLLEPDYGDTQEETSS